LDAETLRLLGRPDESSRWWRTIAQRSPYDVIFEQEATARADRLGLPASTTR